MNQSSEMGNLMVSLAPGKFSCFLHLPFPCLFVFGLLVHCLPCPTSIHLTHMAKFPESLNLIIFLSCSRLFHDSSLPKERGTNFIMKPTFLYCLIFHYPLQMFNSLVQRLEISGTYMAISFPLAYCRRQ